jgi:hypothetical protein
VFYPDLARVSTMIEPPPPEKAEVCLPISYRGILDEARIHKHNA